MAAPKKPSRRKAKNRQTKIHLVFNEDKRKEFLGGFQKRKEERKRKGREQLERKLKAEKQEFMKEKKEMLLKMFQERSSTSELETIVEPVTYDLEDHTVTITSINDVDFQGKNNLLLGQNKECDEESDHSVKVTEAPPPTSSVNPQKIKLKSSKEITSTKAFRHKQRVQQKKLQCKGRKKTKILRKRDKHRGGKQTQNK